MWPFIFRFVILSSHFSYRHALDFEYNDVAAPAGGLFGSAPAPAPGGMFGGGKCLSHTRTVLVSSCPDKLNFICTNLYC